MLLPRPRKYVLTALAGTPIVLDGFLKAVPVHDPAWDVRPDPERFSLREVVAHLADWEPIFMERLTRTWDETNPTLPDVDEGQIAIEHDYAHSDPQASLARFREGRAALVRLLESLPEEAWERPAYRETLGSMNLEQQMIMILGHDGYHTQQVAQWLAASKRL